MTHRFTTLIRAMIITLSLGIAALACTTTIATPTPTPSPTISPADTPIPTDTPSPSATDTATLVPVPTDSPTPVPPTATYTHTPIPTATFTSTPTAANTPTLTPSPTHTPVPTDTPSPIPTSTNTPSPVPPTATYTHTPIPTATFTHTPTFTPTQTNTPTHTPTNTPTYTPTPTPSPTATYTPTQTPTVTPSPTSTDTPTPTNTPTPVPTSYVRLVLGDEVSSDLVRTVRDGAQLMNDYAVLLGMPELESEVVVYADSADNLVDIYYDLFSGSYDISRDWVRKEVLHDGLRRGFASYEYAFINTSVISSKLVSRGLRTVAHEVSHAQSSNLSNLHLSDAGPVWLVEGSAEFLAWRALSAGGVVSYDDKRHLFVQDLEFFRNLDDMDPEALGNLETLKGFKSQVLSISYKYSMFAAELLASHAGESSLIEYYDSLRSGAAWQAVFRNTFGLSIGEFYDLFEQHEAAGFPKLEIPKFVER